LNATPNPGAQVAKGRPSLSLDPDASPAALSFVRQAAFVMAELE
jgi:hypothetical protein